MVGEAEPNRNPPQYSHKLLGFDALCFGKGRTQGYESYSTKILKNIIFSLLLVLKVNRTIETRTIGDPTVLEVISFSLIINQKKLLCIVK